MDFQLFPSMTDCLSPLSEQENKLVQQLKDGALQPAKVQEIKLYALLCVGLPTIVFGALGSWAVNGLAKDFEKAAVQKLEEDCLHLQDRVHQGELKFQRANQISFEVSKLRRLRGPAAFLCGCSGFAFGLAQFRLHIRRNIDYYL